MPKGRYKPTFHDPHPLKQKSFICFATWFSVFLLYFLSRFASKPQALVARPLYLPCSYLSESAAWGGSRQATCLWDWVSRLYIYWSYHEKLTSQQDANKLHLNFVILPILCRRARTCVCLFVGASLCLYVCVERGWSGFVGVSVYVFGRAGAGVCMIHVHTHVFLFKSSERIKMRKKLSNAIPCFVRTGSCSAYFF